MNSLNNKDINQLMGPVSQGSLIQGLILATLATIVLLLACTIIPYAWDAKFGALHGACAAGRGRSRGRTGRSCQSGRRGLLQRAVREPNPVAPAQPAISKKALGGVDEVKQSDPGVNPLDSKIDDLFDKTRAKPTASASNATPPMLSAKWPSNDVTRMSTRSPTDRWPVQEAPCSSSGKLRRWTSSSRSGFPSGCGRPR